MEQPNNPGHPATPNRDLLNQVPKVKLQTAPAGFYASLILDAAIVLFACLTGIFFASYLAGSASILMPIIFLGLFMAFSVLGTLLVKSKPHRAIVIGLESLALILPFWGVRADLMLIALGVMLILIFWGEYLSREDIENSMDIRFFHATRRPLGKLITAIAIIAVIFYIPTWENKGNFISKATFDPIFQFSAKIAGGLYPEFRFDSSVGDLANGIVEGQLKSQTNYTLMPPAQKEQILADSAGQLIKSLGNGLGLKLSPASSISDVLLNFANKSISEIKIKFGAAFTTIWAILIFLLLKSFGSLYAYIIELFSYFIYQFLIAFKIIRVRTENKPHEIVEFI